MPAKSVRLYQILTGSFLLPVRLSIMSNFFRRHAASGMAEALMDVFTSGGELRASNC